MSFIDNKYYGSFLKLLFKYNILATSKMHYVKNRENSKKYTETQIVGKYFILIKSA